MKFYTSPANFNKQQGSDFFFMGNLTKKQKDNIFVDAAVLIFQFCDWEE
jgi:hypothetical protein